MNAVAHIKGFTLICIGVQFYFNGVPGIVSGLR